MAKQTSLQSAAESPSIVTVPDMSSADLIRHATQTLQGVSIDWEFESWDFLKDEDRGMSFEVRTHAFGRRVWTAEVCKHFLRGGYEGNTAAFIAYVIDRRPRGWITSLSVKMSRLYRDRSEHTFKAPCFKGVDLFLASVNDHWSSEWTFASFRRCGRSDAEEA